jgi:hypothetical protein
MPCAPHEVPVRSIGLLNSIDYPRQMQRSPQCARLRPKGTSEAGVNALTFHP